VRAKFISNFERGLNPMDAMNIGSIERRKLNEIFEVIKELAAKYNGTDAILDKEKQFATFTINIKGFNYQYFIGLNIDYPKLDDSPYIFWYQNPLGESIGKTAISLQKAKKYIINNVYQFASQK